MLKLKIKKMKKFFSCLFYLIIISFMFSSCKKNVLPSEDSNAIKTYDFNAVDGIAIKDNGFVLMGQESFGIISRNTKLMKLSGNGNVEWIKHFPFVFTDS